MTNTQTPSGFALTPASPVFWGSAGSIVVSVLLLCLGAYLSSGGETPIALNVALIVLALVEGATGYFTLKGKRVAWAFALSINGTCSVVLLFAAPRIRDAAEVSIFAALVPCLIFGALVFLQALQPEEF